MTERRAVDRPVASDERRMSGATSRGAGVAGRDAVMRYQLGTYDGPATHQPRRYWYWRELVPTEQGGWQWAATIHDGFDTRRMADDAARAEAERRGVRAERV